MLIAKVNEDKTLELLYTEDEIVPKGYIEIDESSLPESLYSFYKLDDNGNIVPDDEKNLEKAKEIKLNEIQSKYDEIEHSGAQCSNGIVMDSTFFDILKLKAGIEFYETNSLTEGEVIDYYNQSHVLSVDEIKTMLNEISSAYVTRWRKKNIMRQEVLSLTDIDDILNYEVEF